MPGSLNIDSGNLKIIEKYKIGRSLYDLSRAPDDNFDASEIDYFGFYHSDGLTTRDREVEKKYRKKDVKRIGKWLRMTNSREFERFESDGRPFEELTRRVFKGIPPPIRTKMWPKLLRVQQAMRPNVYKTMLNYAFDTSTDIRQIDLDINRTFRSTTFFREAFGPRQQALFNILSAYSVYNSEVGYCQGMSDMAGMLLIYIADDEEAFWALAQLLNGPKHKMHSLFVRDFPGLTRFFKHHEKVLQVLLPAVYKHFQEQDVETCTYALKWYMQCFLGRLPISLTLRVWDIFLLDGEKILVAMAYNILKMHHKQLLQMDQAQIISFLQDDISKDFRFDDDDVIDSLKDRLEELRRHRLDKLPALGKDMLPTKTLGATPPVWQPQESVTSSELSSPCTADRSDLQNSIRSKNSTETRVSDDRRRTGRLLNGSGSENGGSFRSASSLSPLKFHSRHSGTPNSPPMTNPPYKSQRSAGRVVERASPLRAIHDLRKPKSVLDISSKTPEDVWFVPSKTGNRSTEKHSHSKSRPPLPKHSTASQMSDSSRFVASEGNPSDGPWTSGKRSSKSHSSRYADRKVSEPSTVKGRSKAGEDMVDSVPAATTNVAWSPSPDGHPNSPIWTTRAPGSGGRSGSTSKATKPVVYSKSLLSDESPILFIYIQDDPDML
uniref:Rab-GAP TBC domain-containing protein n=1 Tax=Schistocephalus solidus TaxID=70667 RepID=A0A0V0J701_SCHSO